MRLCCSFNAPFTVLLLQCPTVLFLHLYCSYTASVLQRTSCRFITSLLLFYCTFTVFCCIPYSPFTEHYCSLLASLLFLYCLRLIAHLLSVPLLSSSCIYTVVTLPSSYRTVTIRLLCSYCFLLHLYCSYTVSVLQCTYCPLTLFLLLLIAPLLFLHCIRLIAHLLSPLPCSYCFLLHLYCSHIAWWGGICVFVENETLIPVSGSKKLIIK